MAETPTYDLVGTETKRLDEIKPYWRNPRDNREAVAVVAESINRYGYQQPIVVDHEGVIIAGHTRWMALRELGAEAATVVVSDLSPEEAREYRIADNASSDVSDWNEQRLTLEMRGLPTPAKMEVFFPRRDVSEIVSGLSRGIDPPDTDVNGAAERLEAERQENVAAHGEGYVEIACPECGSSFALGREEFLTRAQADIDRREAMNNGNMDTTSRGED